MSHPCGEAHDGLKIFRCSKCEKIKKKKPKKQQADEINRANDRTETFKGWRVDPNWSENMKRQFPHGLPPDD